MKLLSSLIGSLLLFIYNVCGNYGISIIILTFLVRLCILPLQAKQIETTAKMSLIQEEVEEINKRYARDRNTANVKINELYTKNGISPYSGCLPLLIQMPIIMGLFALLRNPLEYITASNMIIAVHEPFLWISDLCQPDNWILPILAGISTYFTFSVSSAQQGNAQMNSMKYFYPIMIFLMGRGFPSGLALYWAVGNVLTIAQTLFLNKKREKIMFKQKAEEIAKKNIEKNMRDKTA